MCMKAELVKDMLNPNKSHHHDNDHIEPRMWYSNLTSNQEDGISDDEDEGSDDMYPRASIDVRQAPSIDMTQIRANSPPPTPAAPFSAAAQLPSQENAPTSYDAVLTALSKVRSPTLFHCPTNRLSDCLSSKNELVQKWTNCCI